MEKQNPTQHSMKRRCSGRDYSAAGLYHITVSVAEGLGHPFGQVVGDWSAPDGSADAPHVVLTPIGKMVEHELLHGLIARYPMLEVQDYVVMPEHLHFIIEAHAPIVSRNGKAVPLGTAIAGFKKGCNIKYWEMKGITATYGQAAPISQQAAATHQGKPDGTNGGGGQASTATQQAATTTQQASTATQQAATTTQQAATTTQQASTSSLQATVRVCAPVVSPPAVTTTSSVPAPYKVPSKASTGRPSLFEPGFCDVMPLRAGQLAAQRAYIKANPRTRLLRTTCPWVSTKRGGISTALSPSALRGYLQRECAPSACTPEALEAIGSRLLIGPDGLITCDSYGDRQLLSRPLLPVVCHHKDATRLSEQKARCLQAAQSGTILVSARIAKGEQAIIDEAIAHGYPVVLIADNGFTDRYHPSAERQALCATRHLLLLTPWQYKYRKAEANISPVLCKTMNCLAQALCRQKDSWWKEPSK